MRRVLLFYRREIKRGVRCFSSAGRGFAPILPNAGTLTPCYWHDLTARGGRRGIREGDFRNACVKRGKGDLTLKKGVSWRKIKAEYISGGISQRVLAEKYDVPFGTLSKRARKEHWNAKRKDADEKAAEKVAQKTAEAVADNAATLERLKGKLLARLEIMIDEYPGKNAAELKVRTARTESKYSIRDIAAVYAALEDKTLTRGQGADVEDLAPLAELLKE